MNELFSNERHQRQLQLVNFTAATQQAVEAAKIVVIGAGGLGCPAIQYLTGLGIGHLGVVDDDSVSLSNLPRQLLYHTKDIGRKKVAVIAEQVHALHDAVKLTAFDERLTQHNALRIIEQYDIVLDCSDNFITRYIVSDACRIANKPLVFAAVFQYEGQLAVFDGGENAISYRDIFPTAPDAQQHPNCVATGVYNIATGILGCLQANEAIKLISGLGEVKKNKLVTLNILNVSMYEISLIKNVLNSNAPKNAEELLHYNYDDFCGVLSNTNEELSAADFEQLRVSDDVVIIDIRNEDELPKVPELHALQIPLTLLKEKIKTLPTDKKIILFCHSGIRTQQALAMLQDEYHLKNVSHLKGGIIKWLAYINQ